MFQDSCLVDSLSHVWRGCTAILAFAVLAGGPVRATAPQQPWLVPLDTIRLEEDESIYLTQPRDLVPDPAGGWFVLDSGDPKVLSYSEQGRLRGVIGSEGEGPGEFRTGDALVTMGDTLGVAASNPGVLIFYSGSTGEHLGQVRLPGRVNRTAIRGDTLWVDARSFSARTGLLRLVSPYAEGERLVPLPDEYDGSDGGAVGVLAGAFPSASVAVRRDGLLVGYQPLGHLLVTDRDGTVTDTIRIPAVRRRGTPPDLREALMETMRENYFRIFSVASTLEDLHRLSDGSFAVVHLDNRPVETREQLPPPGQLYVSLLSQDLKRACADLEVPLDPEARPVIGFEGDTLLVLQRAIRPDLGVDTFIVRYRLVTDGCDAELLAGS